MPRPVHFEVHAEHPERAIGFYEAAFGWRFQKWEGPMPYWLITTGEKDEPGIDGGLVQRQGPAPAADAPVHGYVCTVGVDDIDAYLDKALQAGATVALPKMPVPGVGWLVYVKDTEGNLLGMMQDDPSAE